MNTSEHTDVAVPEGHGALGEPSALIWRMYAAGFDIAAVVGPAVLVGLLLGGGGGVFMALVIGVVLFAGQMHMQGKYGWTVAQRQMSLQVLDHKTGEPIGAGRAAQRLVVGAIPGVLTSAQFDLSGRRRGWHDLLMGTEVIDLGVPRPKRQKQVDVVEGMPGGGIPTWGVPVVAAPAAAVASGTVPVVASGNVPVAASGMVPVVASGMVPAVAPGTAPAAAFSAPGTAPLPRAVVRPSTAALPVVGTGSVPAARPVPAGTGPVPVGTGSVDAGTVRDTGTGAVPSAATGVLAVTAPATGPIPMLEPGPGQPSALIWRLYAAMFDVLAVAVPVVVAAVFVSGPSGVVLAFELGMCILVVQFFLQGRFGGTIAQGLMRLRVVDEWTGEPIGIGRAVRRATIIGAGAVVFGVGALVVVISPKYDKSGKKQGWHDRFAGTVVLDMWAPPKPMTPVSTTGAERIKHPTADDVPVHAEPALVMWRLYAAMFDVAAVVIPSALVGATLGAFFAVVTAVGLTAWQMVELGNKGRTIGQRLMRLRVVDEATKAPIGVGRATQRLFLVAAGGLVLGVGALVVLTSAKFDRTNRRRGWDDLITGSETIDTWKLRPELEHTVPTKRSFDNWEKEHQQITAELGLPDGSKRKVGGVVLVGSDPRAAKDSETVLPLPDAGPTASKTHLRMTVGPIAVWIEDLESETGTSIRLPDGMREMCTPGVQMHVPVGSVIEFGDARVVLHRVIDPISGPARFAERRRR